MRKLQSIKSAIVAFVLLIWMTGCGLLGSSQSCEREQPRLLIRTGQSSYDVGDTAVVVLENCLEEAVFPKGSGMPDYRLEKRTDTSWKKADSKTVLRANVHRLSSGETERVFVPIEPSTEEIGVVPGTYRIQLFIYDEELPEGRLFPVEERVSNVFSVNE